ncbi:MAG: protein BglA2 [Candidatus Peregrinibacteria bacterium Greene0416_19]|nr:MAG: protein BglA2 [Candidatus Peregrinibacteria bacterium Greene0416_19]
MRPRLLSAATALLLVVPIFLQAKTFPDLSKTSVHFQAVDVLSDQGVITGNPDGTFRPKNAVNRAAFLAMLYRTAGITPDGSKNTCFQKEFARDVWFAPTVCDAVARGYVKGYADGKFRPENPVSFAEGTKMAIAVFGLPMEEDQDLSGLPPSVAADAWYAGSIAFAWGKFLPLPDQSLATFFPNDPMERQQAASVIYQARTYQQSIPSDEPDVSSSSVSSASSASSVTSATPTRRSSSSAATHKSQAEVKAIAFPFDDAWQFSARNSITYTFSVPRKMTVDAVVRSAQNGLNITCRLSKVETDGFVFELHPGYHEPGSCLILTTLMPGDYQLFLQPQNPNTPYTVSVKEGKGTGNDGVADAKELVFNQVKTDYLDVNDLENWYKFTVAGPEEGKELSFEVFGGTVVNCLLYPWKDVDVYGFTSPLCSERTTFTPGTYYARISHGDGKRLVKQTYTLRVK